MKQHERTHKPGHSGRSAAAAGSTDSASSAAPAGKTGGPRKRTFSGSTMASLTSSAAANAASEIDDDEDEDADGDLDMEVAHGGAPVQPLTAGSGAVKERPSLGKSKLSEILEQEQIAARDTDMDAEGEADGEGESPGLDALATVATEEMGRGL